MDGYSLTKRWFDWCFKNQGHFSPTHAALYQWYMEWCNRSHWPEQFEMDPKYAMAAIGIRSYNTYKDTLVDLHDWGFVRVLQVGANQHYPWLIALSKFDEPLDEPRNKATIDASSKFDNPLNKARDKARNNPFDNPRDAYTINSKQETETGKQEPKVILFASLAASEPQTGTSSVSVLVPSAQSQGLPSSNPDSAAPLSSPVDPPPEPEKPKQTVEQRIEAFTETVRDFYRANRDKYPVELYTNFIRYWTEPTNNQKRFRREIEKTWDLAGRLAYWHENDQKRQFKPNGNPTNSNRQSANFLTNQRRAEPAKNGYGQP